MDLAKSVVRWSSTLAEKVHRESCLTPSLCETLRIHLPNTIHMKIDQQFDPIFVHASPRSGSTYFFNVLRQNTSLMCFNEAIIDSFSYYSKDDLVHLKSAQKWNVNHHFLDRDDVDEILTAWDAVAKLYPPFPSFQDYLPPSGEVPLALGDYLAGLMQHARSLGKRPVLCEIHSRGRAGALRSTFNGFHIAQYRDPLSQFGSFLRPLFEAGEWGFLTFPLMELGISGEHPLYQLVPEPWRVPVLPWPKDNRAQRWSSAVQYISMVATAEADTLERAFRWHLCSWFLSNLAAVCFSDAFLDIDRVNDDSSYRQGFIADLSSRCGVAIEFRNLSKFSRYYEFGSFDIANSCEQVLTAMRHALLEGHLDKAICTLGTQPPVIAAAVAAEILITKIKESLAAMATTTDRHRISETDWQAITAKHRKIWFNAGVRALAQRIYPFAAPLARAARRMRVYQ